MLALITLCNGEVVPENSVDEQLLSDLSEIIDEQTRRPNMPVHAAAEDQKIAADATTEALNGEADADEARLTRELQAAEADLRRQESKLESDHLLSQQQLLAVMLTRKKGAKTLHVSGAASNKYLHSKAPIFAKLSAVKKTVSLAEGVKLRFTVSNPTAQHLRILNWETPFEGMLASMFVVRDQDGIRIPYIGADARRRPPETATNADFTMVPPKGSKSVVVDLSRAYRFAKDGKYYVRVNQPKDSHVHYSDVMKSVVSVEVKNTHKATKKLEREFEKVAPGEAVLLQNGLTHVGCSADQITMLAKWQADAQKWVQSAKACTVNKNDSCEKNARLWFGNTTQSAFAFSVIKTLKNMHERAKDSKFRCDGKRCTASTFGYVYPDDVDQNVFICPFSFSYAVQSEKRQTLIHELSHFNFIGVNEGNQGIEGERDLGYGEVNCQALAKTDSANAMNNADNVAYFTRDIALKSDPSCTDLSSSCPVWAAQHDCAATYTGIGVLKKHCCKSCGHATAVSAPGLPPEPPAPGKTHSGGAPLRGSWNALFAAAVAVSCLLISC